MTKRWLLWGMVCGMLLHSASAFAAGWRVIPIRLDFDRNSRSGVVTLANDSDQPISFSVEAMEWTQDAQGVDHYTATTDLVFFPKVLNVPPSEERVIRAGLKVPPVKTEKTYRLFIKEEPQKRENQGAAVAIAVRFGVPVFAKPAREELRGEIAQATLAEGKLQIDVRNTGNIHFRIDSTRISGKDAAGSERFNQDLKGWYLLSGAGRTLTTEIPAETCRQLSTLEISATGTGVQFSGKIDVDPTHCQTP